MSSLAAQKTVRTYSRQKKRSLHDDEPPAKRRRVGTTIEGTDIKTLLSPTILPSAGSSSPTRDTWNLSTSSPKISPAIFSDAPAPSSPPSSPTLRSSPPPPNKRRALFSLFRKKTHIAKPTKQPLAERSHNAQGVPEQHTKKKRMVQMQLDLVGEHRKACTTCGMEYIPSNAEDAALHRKFHAMNLGGVDFTKPVVERFRRNQIWSGDEGSFIAVIGRKDVRALRNKASEVLEIVNTELAAVPIQGEELWGQAGRTFFADAPIEEAKAPRTQVPGVDEASQPLVDRFKMYLYIRNSKCVGACLAERIWEAYTVLDPHAASEQACQIARTACSSSISISTVSDLAILGISRIWTSSEHRKGGIATRLLESARSDFLYGLTIEKEQVAFSQPTESGQNLARKWFRKEAGWHVYID